MGDRLAPHQDLISFTSPTPAPKPAGPSLSSDLESLNFHNNNNAVVPQQMKAVQELFRRQEPPQPPAQPLPRTLLPLPGGGYPDPNRPNTQLQLPDLQALYNQKHHNQPRSLSLLPSPQTQMQQMQPFPSTPTQFQFPSKPPLPSEPMQQQLRLAQR